MTLATRSETPYRVNTAHANNPLALGPILGRMMIATNLSPSIAAAWFVVHETTLYRWMFGQSQVKDRHVLNMGIMIATLNWILETRGPLEGTTVERRKLFLSAVHHLRTEQKT